jgi:CheY-like chemotaxis protein
MHTVLLVDDSPEYTAMISEFLTSMDWRCEVAGSAQEAEQLLAQDPGFAVAAVDLVMAGGSGVRVIEKCLGMGLPVVAVTGLPIEAANRVCPQGVPVLSKPFDLFHFERVLSSLAPVIGRG